MLLAGAISLSFLATAAQAQYKVMPQYMIGIDARSDSTGTYLGLDNPNYGRLTMLYAHTYVATPDINHFHRIGAYAYTGPNLGAGTATTFTNPTLPEGGVERLQLKQSGGHWVSGLDTASEYEGLAITTITRIESMAQSSPTSPEGYLYNSSLLPVTSLNAGQPRYAALQPTAAQLAFELVGITPGLSIGTAAGSTILTNPGDRYALGTGNNLATNPFTPVFWSSVPQTNTQQNFVATFRVVDTRSVGALPSSGNFTYNFSVAAAPEPASLALCLLALPLVMRLRRLR
jgi:hypothetical protein